MWLYLAAALGYLVALVALGVWWGRRGAVAGADDFLLAGRALPAHVLLFTLLSSWVGSGSLFGGAGLAYQVGLPALWQLAGAWAGMAVIVVIAPRVRELGQYTVADILDLRYGPHARLLGTIALVLAYTAIAAFQFRGGGRLLNLVAGIDIDTGAIITASFCVLLTALGGMRTVARLDVVNGLAIIAGVGLATVYLLGNAGGFRGVAASLGDQQLTVFGSLSPRQALALFLSALCVLLSEATMYQKLSSARDPRAARLAVAGWLGATVIVECLIIGIGLVGRVVMPGLDSGESDAIVLRVAVSVLPTVLGMLLVAAAAAIVVSTANSMLLTPAANLVRDVYLRFVNPAGDRHVVPLMRIALVLLAALGVVGGTVFPTTLTVTLWAYTMYVAGVTPALVAALVWPRATRQAGLYSIAAGIAVTLIWELVAMARGTVAEPAYVFGIQTIFPALLASIGTLIAVAARRQP